LLNFCVCQLLNIKKNPDQVADAASDMAILSIKDPEPVPEEENEEVAHEGESKSAEALEADKDDSRQHLNVVFIGHVDAGKSTIGGQILYLSNMVDERTIQKYEREAKEKNRESW
jgi:peptide chain release factor subunit 3